MVNLVSNSTECVSCGGLVYGIGDKCDKCRAAETHTEEKTVLVTGGNAGYPIDDVRDMGNKFRGRTSIDISMGLVNAGFKVILLTSHPELVPEHDEDRLSVKYYKYVPELHDRMHEYLTSGTIDALIHSAAIADYKPEELFSVESIEPWDDGTYHIVAHAIPMRGKVAGSYAHLLLGLRPGINLAQKVRSRWYFKGPFFMFKLERGISNEELANRGLDRILKCGADGIITNCLEWMYERAIAVYPSGRTADIERADLPNFMAAELWSRLDL
jgi:phosphopantothenate---cysteine ligase (CTP)